MFVVKIYEFDRFSGIDLLETLRFATKSEAMAYTIKFNTENKSESYVPEWYMHADYCGME